jgi:hypothetical protein
MIPRIRVGYCRAPCNYYPLERNPELSFGPRIAPRGYDAETWDSFHGRTDSASAVREQDRRRRSMIIPSASNACCALGRSRLRCHWPGVHVLLGASFLQAPRALTPREFAPAFGLTKPFAVFGISFGAFTAPPSRRSLLNRPLGFSLAGTAYALHRAERKVRAIDLDRHSGDGSQRPRRGPDSMVPVKPKALTRRAMDCGGVRLIVWG